MISEYTKHYWKSIQQPPGKHLEREERFPFTSGWLLKKSEIFIHLSYSLDSFSHLNKIPGGPGSSSNGDGVSRGRKKSPWEDAFGIRIALLSVL